MSTTKTIEKYIGALGLIGVLMVVYYGTGIVLNFKNLKKTKLETKILKEKNQKLENNETT